MSGRTDLLGGLSPIMVASHIRAMTLSARPARNRHRIWSKLMWVGVGVLLAQVLR